MRAYYATTVSNFLLGPVNEIVGVLTLAAAGAGFYQQQHSQTEAWYAEISILKKAFFENTITHEWHLLLEYTIPRRAKRADAIVLAKDIILVIEFKVGSSTFLADDIAQVEDYALDLRDFHFASRNRTIIPVLVATEAESISTFVESSEKVKETIRTNAASLGEVIFRAFEKYGLCGTAPINYEEWEVSEYRPTPTIIEAAQTLYSGQDVIEISRSYAGVENLTATTNAVLNAVESARKSNSKLICFITGVPGAGKTLAGLNIVHNNSLHDEDLGVFLSGNGPLVKVLSEALARDHARKNGISKQEALRKVSTFIQNVHRFLDAYFENKAVPVDKVVIFDEAQRAWNAEQSKRKFKRNFSEPEMMLNIMDRHKDWAVIVALIGGGQEINSGEAGIAEWGRTLLNRFSYWNIHISPQLLSGHHSTGGQTLFEDVPRNLTIAEDNRLHLQVSIRAYRAEQLSDFVANLLDVQPSNCRNILRKALQEYPIVLTRNLELAKEWLRIKQRGTRRIGIVASSGARRIKPYGYDVSQRLDVANWFLNPPDDVRSSFYLEDVATEFDIQGLELDWTCLCWGADFRYNGTRWTYNKFRGTSWQNINNFQTREYIKNKYRVLLTRAREGVVIWVPPGNREEKTRLPEFYDGTADYLTSCGIPNLLDFSG